MQAPPACRYRTLDFQKPSSNGGIRITRPNWYFICSVIRENRKKSYSVEITHKLDGHRTTDCRRDENGNLNRYFHTIHKGSTRLEDNKQNHLAMSSPDWDLLFLFQGHVYLDSYHCLPKLFNILILLTSIS